MVFTSVHREDSSQLPTPHSIPYRKDRFTEEIQRPHSINPASAQTSCLLVHPSLPFRCKVSMHKGLPDSSLAAVGYWSLILKLHLHSRFCLDLGFMS